MPSVYSMSSETSCRLSAGADTVGPPEAPTSSLACSVSSSASSFLMERDAVAMSQEKKKNATRWVSAAMSMNSSLYWASVSLTGVMIPPKYLAGQPAKCCQILDEVSYSLRATQTSHHGPEDRIR